MPSDHHTRAEVRITGIVQGVTYRAWTQRTARELGVVGWVRNEPDRSVAGLFVGPADAVQTLIERCHDGPTHARVDEVAVQTGPPRDDEDFTDLQITR